MAIKHEKFKEILSELSRLNSCIDRLNDSEFLFILQNHEDMFERFSPFKIGDRVELIKTPIINEKEGWGWLSFKHMLVKGAVGTVKESEFYSKKFRFCIEFDEDTWHNTVLNIYEKREPKGLFNFSEDFLVKHLDNC
jgi:hypothetical protein